MEQYSIQIETLAGAMNLEVKEDTFDNLKSILIKYHESKLDVLVIDIVGECNINRVSYNLL